LFVVQSDPLQHNISELEDTCDYAVKSGLDIIVYFGSYEMQRNTTVAFVDTAQERWGSHFLGVYYGDEPSGKALDGIMRFDNIPNIGNVSVSRHDITISQTYGSIMMSKAFYYSPDFSGQINVQYVDSAVNNYTMTNYFPNGTIVVSKNWGLNPADSEYFSEYLIYLPNGTVLKQTSFPSANNDSWVYNGTVLYQEGLSSRPSFSAVTDRGNISQFEPYQQLWDSRPFQTMDDMPAVATSYVKTQQATTDWIHNQTDVKLFTSDYVLYWWDYLSGYDVVLAQLGWNNTVAQEIGLVRGAANLQGKSWGVILTWKYTESPYLARGDEIYSQMRTAYECGARYVVVFNYAENMTEPYGILQKEHFDALERFWNEVVQNPEVAHGGIKADAALVLPRNYGWGMRNPNDTIWSLWCPDEKSQQVWAQLQSTLAKQGLRLDIVYDDPAYPVTGKYSQIYYWNQTG
jgi:hypothetical protein